MSTFDDELIRLLCEIIKKYGGSCESLPKTVEAFLAAVEQYAASGAPSLPTHADVDDFLKLLDQIEDWQLRPDNDLTPQQNDRLAGVIKLLRSLVKP